ncbi:MAG: hypothetical protein ACFCVK_05110 [Acidimicrobiales bacterium]
MAHGDLLVAFAEAVVTRAHDLIEVRAELVARVGPAAAGQAAATVAAFSGLVRVADGTGIPVDEGMAAASADIRHDLALDRFGGAANTAPAAPAPFTTVDDLWLHRP